MTPSGVIGVIYAIRKKLPGTWPHKTPSHTRSSCTSPGISAWALGSTNSTPRAKLHQSLFCSMHTNNERARSQLPIKYKQLIWQVKPGSNQTAFIDSFTSQTSRDSNKTLSSQEKVLTKDQIRFYCKSIRDSFEELKLKSCTSSLGAWRLIEKGLATRKVELEVVDIFHEISYGFLKPNDFEFEKISKQFNDQCSLVESFYDIEAMKKFPPLLRVREFISNF